MVSVRTLLVVSLVHNWDVQQLDINNAFLRRDIHEEVYMKLTDNGSSSSLSLTALGFSQSHANSSLFAYYKDKDALYALDLIDYAGLQNEKPSKTPLDPRIKLTYTDGESLADPSHFRTLVGKLIYLSISRPYIAFVAQLLRQGLFFPKINYPVIHAYCDSDWASCPSSRRSVSGFEYIALADCSCEITWLCSLLKDLKVIVPKPVRILYENISTIALASNPIQHARINHIEIDCHFVRDKIKAGQIITSYIPTTAQDADIFTKALTTYPFNQCLSKLGMCDPYTLPTWGGGGNGINTKGKAKVNSATMVQNREGNREEDTSKAHNNVQYISPHRVKHQKYLFKCSAM
ncbi:homogeneously-staining region [Tanacetum coccineum]